jgi:hypothetical protein
VTVCKDKDATKSGNKSIPWSWFDDKIDYDFIWGMAG